MNWEENRLVLFTNESVNVDPQRIWSPNFELQTELVSKEKIEDDRIIAVSNHDKLFNVESENEHFQIATAKMQKLSYIRTTFVCDMEFYSFPFEQHICKLEVYHMNLYMKNNFIFNFSY